LFGKLFAGQSNYFHGADDAARILFVNFFVGRRIAFFQFAQQRFKRRGFQFGAQFWICGGRFAESAQERLEIKSRAAAEDWNFISRLDFFDRLLREADELRGVEIFRQVADVNEVMRHAGALGGRRFGRADVESAINLHGIHRDDFAAEFFREAQGDFRFTDGGWSCKKNRRDRINKIHRIKNFQRQSCKILLILSKNCFSF